MTFIELTGVRTLLGVPDAQGQRVYRCHCHLPPGSAAVHRQADRTAANFAAQAVIAIENTRLLNELREFAAAADRHRRRAQGHQPFDVRSAQGADALVELAAVLCQADKAQILRPTEKDASYYSAASYGHTAEYNEYIRTSNVCTGARRCGRPSSAGGQVCSNSRCSC